MIKRGFYFLLICILGFSEMAYAQYIPRFDVQGHRGARGLKPENTIPAFIAALNYGVTTVELDLAVTKDGQLVVSHEPWMSSDICLDSVGNEISDRNERRHNIFQMTYDEIRQFDCGSKYNPAFPQQEKIAVSKPLLTDVIIAIEDHIKSYTQYEVDYNIEIKSSPQGDGKYHPTPEVFSDLVYNTLDQYLPMERVIIQSFDFRVLKYWHMRYPEVRLAALVENALPINSNLNELGFLPSVYSPYFKLLTEDRVRFLHQKGIRVIPWTVNEKRDMERLRSWRVDGIITDYPDRSASLGLNLKISSNR